MVHINISMLFALAVDEEPYNNETLTELVALYEICFEQAWKAMKELLLYNGIESEANKVEELRVYECINLWNVGVYGNNVFTFLVPAKFGITVQAEGA